MKKALLISALVLLPCLSWAQSVLAPMDMANPLTKQIGGPRRTPPSTVKLLDKNGKLQGQIDQQGNLYDKQGRLVGNVHR